MTAMFSIDDLTTISEEPLILDLLLAERLEFDKPHNIRNLINRHMGELRNYGEVWDAASHTSPQGGRPGREYYLNEDQAVLVSMFSRTPKAAEVRKALIEIYKRWRAEHGSLVQGPALPPPPPPPAQTINVGLPAVASEALTLRDKLAAVTVTRQIFGLEAARAMWPRVGLPEVRMAGAPVDGPPDKDGTDALQLLLSCAIGTVSADDDHEDTVFDLVQEALQDDAGATEHLRDFGLRLLEDGEGGNDTGDQALWVAYAAPGLRSLFAGTRFADGWRLPLKALPGARPSSRPHKVRKAISNGVCIPMDTVTRLRPGAALTWNSGFGGNEAERKRPLA